jgi:serine/threonine protein kinase
MFDKQGEMKTAKSAGSPAFMPPELCVPKHGEVSGKAADIWSMGVTLYCLMFGRIPFEKHGMLELYQAIRADDPEFEIECNDQFKDLLLKLLEKEPERRIKMKELRVWSHERFSTLMACANNIRNIHGSHYRELIPCYQHRRTLRYLWTQPTKK